MMNNAFVYGSSAPWTAAGDGVRRQILASGPDIMLVSVAFETGAIGVLHHHPHRQASYVVSGVYTVTVDGVTRELRAGDSFHVAADLVHGATAVEGGTIIDVFTPAREDFLR